MVVISYEVDFALLNWPTSAVVVVTFAKDEGILIISYI